MTATPDQPAAPAKAPQPTSITLNRTQKGILGSVAAGGVVIAGIGFAGSYRAVVKLAEEKHFGDFAAFFPIGIDAGIGVLLALDLVLTWLRIPFPMLRQGAWGLTAATIAFNAAAAWGDDLAVGMHAAIPALFVIIVEAARHAVGRLADIVAERHIESPPWQRWLLSPFDTFFIWRLQRVWQIPSYLRVIELRRELRVYRAKLRRQHGWRWRWKANADELLPFAMARFGISVLDALAMPETEAEAQRQAEVAREAEARRNAEAEAEALRAEESKRLAEAEARRVSEAETEAKLAEIANARRLAEAETEAALSAQEQQRLNAETEAEVRRMRLLAEQRDAEAEAKLKQLALAEEAARRTAEAETEATRAARERLRLAGETETLRDRTYAPKSKQSGTDDDPNPKSKQSGERPSRRLRIDAEVETLLGLMTSEGYDAVDLKRAMAELNLKQTTAYDRLLKAQEKWLQTSTGLTESTDLTV
ncbi:DUF2637 domain-containing protein [Kitasatospora sp. NPDC004745]|uniref:DUF2637 domain-containing protein n=1 Tax=Kitasatospora sp. NPDC004745 TaxID=3364019 RepID=UPI0036A9F8B1